MDALQPRLLDRDLSWLDFNARVLALAEDDATPLLERAKFCAIFATNLDEFFMVRVADMRDAHAREGGTLRRAADLATRHAAMWADRVAPGLAAAGISVARWADLDEGARQGLAGFFAVRVYPVLTPLAVDPAHPIPYISNRSLSLAVILRDQADGALHFARVKVPPNLGRFLPVVGPADGRLTFLPLEELVAGNLDGLFPGMEVLASHAFRVTRGADLAIEAGTDDLLRMVEDELRRRRAAAVVRLELADDTPPEIEARLARALALPPSHIHRLPQPLGLGDLWELHAVDRADLRDPLHLPATAPALVPDADGEVEIMERVARGEVLIHQPYESFSASVQAFIEQAADDPQVLAIKQTLYRTTADPIVNALVRAAEAGKQVVVLVELKARFDEEANLGWARILERAGCHVVYGVTGLKTHAKLVLVARREGSSVRRYVHVGTGNYNAQTARSYEDLGLLSAEPSLADAVGELFNLLTGHARHASVERLLVAPYDLRRRLIERIGHEADEARAGRPARIVLKVNALADAELIEALYAADAAGVDIDVIARAICTLRPGVEGLSSRTRVRSIVGRFLEHSRVFRFGVGDAAETWIGSADLMERNLDRRVEVMVRVVDPQHLARLSRILQLAMADDASAWNLGAAGEWSPPANGAGGIRLQERLLADASAPAEPEPPDDAPIRAAGGVVWRNRGGRLELAIIHRPQYDDWSFPKGKLLPAEEPLSAALREVSEETGLDVNPGPSLGETQYRKATTSGSRVKLVSWWSMEAVGGSFDPSYEVDAMRWMTPKGARRLLTRGTDRDLLSRFLATPEASVAHT